MECFKCCLRQGKHSIQACCSGGDDDYGGSGGGEGFVSLPLDQTQDKACRIMQLPAPGLLCKAGGLATSHNAAMSLPVAALVQPLASLLTPSS